MIQKKVGLARALSKTGYCSRSQAAILIRAGRVTRNGSVVRDPEFPVRMPHDLIAIDASPLVPAPPIYLAMNKPRGVVTTAADEKQRKTVYGLLDSGLPWVSPVGRLDQASEGLLLFTNDSEWAAKITDPSSHLEKKYHVQVNCVPTPDLLARIVRGCQVRCASDAVVPPSGRSTERLSAKMARLLRHGGTNSWLEITLEEGKNRHIRRLLEGLEVRVLRLVRVSIGSLELGDLKKGATRSLTTQEKLALDRAVRLLSRS
jgi:23S rRNA pseudouridine2605 synthase